jgi:uncharacterized protein (AIM24 family)
LIFPDQGFVGNLMGVGKRTLTRESLFMTQFANSGSSKGEGSTLGAIGGLIETHGSAYSRSA